MSPVLSGISCQIEWCLLHKQRRRKDFLIGGGGGGGGAQSETTHRVVSNLYNNL